MSQTEEKPENIESERRFQDWVLEFFRKRADRARKEYELVKRKVEEG